MSLFRAVASPCQMLGPLQEKAKLFHFWSREELAGSALLPPLLCAHKLWDSCIAAICMLWENSHTTRRFGTWNQEKYLNLFYTPLEVWIWHF